MTTEECIFGFAGALLMFIILLIAWDKTRPYSRYKDD